MGNQSSGARGRHDGLVSVYCWCGAQIVGVTQQSLDNRETGECGPGCKARFIRRGVKFPATEVPA